MSSCFSIFDTSTFDTSTFDTSTSNTSTSNTSIFDTSTFDTSTFDTFDTSTSNTSTFGTSTFGTSTFDFSIFDTSTSNTSTFDISTFDTSTFDTSTFDTSTFDTSTFDTSTFDTSTFDTSTFDTSTSNTSTFDTSIFNTSTFDTSTFDTSTFDTSTSNTSTFDTSTFDTPIFDTSISSCSSISSIPPFSTARRAVGINTIAADDLSSIQAAKPSQASQYQRFAILTQPPGPLSKVIADNNQRQNRSQRPLAFYSSHAFHPPKPLFQNAGNQPRPPRLRIKSRTATPTTVPTTSIIGAINHDKICRKQSASQYSHKTVNTDATRKRVPMQPTQSETERHDSQEDHAEKLRLAGVRELDARRTTTAPRAVPSVPAMGYVCLVTKLRSWSWKRILDWAYDVVVFCVVYYALTAAVWRKWQTIKTLDRTVGQHDRINEDVEEINEEGQGVFFWDEMEL
ncbi:hypothetical protein K490DRAFT_61546 [Saccharata proteae CBS 121410]|uniref:Uncharacterized protein n=1 Tax=Saccharata proteae CBS 121410 TaxID=1314787 RepID=A0A9P4I4S2_9PEZI|nr:hypothetical protein K490DRAFT_61546 [Saccharata proteae CBS 121410]